MASVRLSNSIKEGIVRKWAQSLLEEAEEKHKKYASIVYEHCLAGVPPLLKQCMAAYPKAFDMEDICVNDPYDSPERHTDMTRYDGLSRLRSTRHTSYKGQCIPNGFHVCDTKDIPGADDAWKEYVDFAIAVYEKYTTIRSAIFAFSTAKQLIEAIPAIEQFVPVRLEDAGLPVPLETIENARKILAGIK